MAVYNGCAHVRRMTSWCEYMLLCRMAAHMRAAFQGRAILQACGAGVYLASSRLTVRTEAYVAWAPPQSSPHLTNTRSQQW